MNTIDLLIIILLIGAVVRGLNTGILRLVLSFAGFALGIYLGLLGAKLAAPHISNPLTRLLVVMILVLGLGLLLTALGEMASLRLAPHTERLHLGKLNRTLGAILEIVLTVLVVWLAASALINVRSYDLGNSVRRSWIIQKLDNSLPPAPDILARLEKIISPNGFPNVFLGLEPQHTTISPNNSVDNQAILAAEQSVVKIQGTGCGGIVDGSGFVIANGLIVTNAHVVAGIERPEVVDASGRYRATVIWFDQNMDIAVLRVNNPNDPALTLSDHVLPDGDAAAVLGFPGGGPLVVSDAAIIDHVTAAGRNIYNQGVVFRSIYEVQADVEPGNSGGPLLSPDGSVAGVVFAKSVSQGNIGYALLISQIKPLIQKAEAANTPVSTGTCAQD